MASAGRIPFLHQLYNHIVLPRNLPGKEDGNLYYVEASLLERMLDAVVRLSPHVNAELQPFLYGLHDTLLSCQILNVNGAIGKPALTTDEPSIVFEAFETSATADKVLATKGALQWDFPGSAVSVPESTFNEVPFRDALATFIEQASSEYVTKFAAVTWKAAATIPEIRDTSNPAIVSGLLLSILEANGAAIQVPRLQKRVRDTATFNDALKPWRRSPFYLVLRVAAQRYLYHHMGAVRGRHYYKTLMCLVHAQLLEDGLRRLPLEAAYFLRQKLGRRLAKLSADIRDTGTSSTGGQSHIQQYLERNFEGMLATTGAYLKQVWRNHRQSRERYIPILRQFANLDEFRLRLTNSGRVLRDVLVEHASLPRPRQRTATEYLGDYEESATSVKPYMRALFGQIASSQYHEDVVLPAKHSIYSDGLAAIKLSRTIREYIHKICTGNQVYPYQKSQQLLHVMELWVLMDSDAVTCYPLLRDYHPGFDADILDPIELLTLQDMDRAQGVRRYLAARHRPHSNTHSNTIFDDPADDCFAARFYDDHDIHGTLTAMREEIEEAADTSRMNKQAEWEVKSAEYEQICLKLNEKECIYDTVMDRDLRVAVSRHRQPCEWHDLHNKLKHMRIRIFEHPLPSYEPAAKAAIFELQCPEVFAAYRDATWLILSRLCHPPVEELDRISIVRNYSQLQPYTNSTSCHVTLGSYKKAHLESHYATWGFPIGLQEIIRTCGLKPRYYDKIGAAWTDRTSKASFWHHFPLRSVPNSPFSVLGLDYATWPTSNQIQASQARCPQGMSVHEFIALQSLLVGNHSRWVDLLRELGSTNLNFSSESTWVAVLRLVLQHGPCSEGTSSYTDAHRSLLDDDLSNSILKQVQYRLDAIKRNWRESLQMEILITVLLKITSLTASASVENLGMELLREARKIADSWRRELQAVLTEDSSVLQSAIWASLLCRRTLHIGAQLEDNPESIRTWLDASISVHHNLAGDFDCMPYSLRNAVVQDVLFAYANRGIIRSTLLSNPQMFMTTLKDIWHVPDDLEVTEAGLKVIPSTWWMALALKSTTGEHSYFVHYNYLYGTLLIDGKEMGTLPLSYRTQPTFRHIFGARNPIVYPSPLRGMQFTLCETMRNGHRIHLGFINGRLLIRADQNGELLEFVPSEVFRSDLPTPLVENCYHWLHVHGGQVEIRQKDPWTPKLMNWWIRRHPSGVFHAIRRFQEPHQVTLLDPASQLVQSITQIFTNFEFPSQILVFASLDGQVHVELKRMELSFNINQHGLLQSPRFGAFIPRSQDAGTWYGLKNMILIQSIANRRQRSILVPTGDIRVSKDGPHVSVTIEMSEGVYLKYAINEVLGRVDCAPEPQLLYTKTLLHAYTSHVIPDPLTKRTGTEEALYLLQSAAYQPWNPLRDGQVNILRRIAALSPERGYYPKDARCMETVLWNAECTIYMQDDRYGATVARILRKSSNLSHFFLDRHVQQVSQMPAEIAHLAARALMRSGVPNQVDYGNHDAVYRARDTRAPSKDCLNVQAISKLLLDRTSPCTMDATLLALLHDAPVIGGYDKLYRKTLLSDHLGVDIRAEWGALAQRCLLCNADEKFGLMFLLGALAFSTDVNLDLLRVLVFFSIRPDIRALTAPQHTVYYHFRADGAPPTSYLVSLMAKARMPFSETGFKKRSQLVKAESLHGPSVDIACEKLARSIAEQWPSSDIDMHKLVTVDAAHIDIHRAVADVTPEWVRLTQNYELALYLEQVQELINRVVHKQVEDAPSAPLIPDTRQLTHETYPTRMKTGDNMTLSRLLQSRMSIDPTRIRSPVVPATISHAGVLGSRSGNIIRQSEKYNTNSVGKFGVQLRGASIYHNPTNILGDKKIHQAGTVAAQSREIGMLRNIVAKFKDPSSFVQCRYAMELDASIDALVRHMMSSKKASHRASRDTAGQLSAAKSIVTSIADQIRYSFHAGSPRAKWLQMVDLWPRMTMVDLLTELRESSKTDFGPGTKEALVRLGLAITKLQQLLRIHDAQKRDKKQQELEECSNEGHTNWSALEHPDWLLLEIDGDVLLREEQVDVAIATASPESAMVATLLADRSDLARVVVPRALLLQSAQVMQVKLGGLVNRELMHLPFSRKTPPKERLIRLYGKMLAELRDRQGVLLALPEHILSFKLSGLQQLCDGHFETASKMIEIQWWLDQHSRDILDECDVSLAIRTQLIYPSGTQTTVDGHPMRWQVTQAVLHLVKDFSSTVQSRYPRSIEVVKRGMDGFPLIYFLRKDAEDCLIGLLVKIICKGQTPSILPCAEYSLDINKDIETYISNPNVRSPVVSRVSSYFRDRPTLMRTINLLRGLFVHRILITTLRKRWNVQYGLHPTRAPIAVPYLAKGVPSPTAEWGHPDVAITLTCLSFYYQGLSIHQFKEAFEHLVKTDEPSIEYEKWFPKGCAISRELDDYASINAEDARQLCELHQVVRSSAPLIDFFLNNFVFPKYAKTFRLKLQASGWNLFPSVATEPNRAGSRVTGFSGTNDSRHQLPLLIQQHDLPQLAHTNAEVPLYLLAPRNQFYTRMVFSNGIRWTETDFLRNLAHPNGYIRINNHRGTDHRINGSFQSTSHGPIRILIDAGAQVLEHSNRDFAKAWLEEDKEAAAAVFFDDDHRVWVLYRTNKCVPLVASPFVDNLDRCVVYLDESHCRGTDLKFPPHARAALTLGQHLTKDALVQAAMRLRLLGQTQSIMFFSPPEVHQGILDRLGNTDEFYRPSSGDVLQWVFGQTCDTMEQYEPSFFAQTSQYLQQEQAHLEYPQYLEDSLSRDSFLAKVRIEEALTLKQLYQPKSQRQNGAVKAISWHPLLEGISNKLQQRKKHFQDRGTAVHASALEEVEIEQEREAEREVEVEVENVREVQEALLFNASRVMRLREDVLHFATHGRLVAGSDAYRPMFTSLSRTALGLKYTVNPSMKSGLWITAQFSRTIETYEPNDNYIRPSHWILWSFISQQALMVSPEEADEILPIVRDSHLFQASGKVHLIAYAAPATRRMLHFNKLDYYATPSLPADFQAPVWLRVELGLFAGRLYIEWDEYYELLGYLGLGEDLSQHLDKLPFAKKPLSFLHEWISLRRKGQDFEHTPMGFVTSGKPLTENHPFFRVLSGEDDPSLRPHVARHAPDNFGENQEDDGDDHDDEEFVPAIDHVDDSEGEDGGFESSSDEDYVDAEDGE
ncbi:hypothetical protein TW65_01843 [Stemphylium lycopersici]|nr:hypothetical protein TW65_01843 [Stemphylium lycopersici]